MRGATVLAMLLLFGATLAFSGAKPAYRIDALLPSDGAESIESLGPTVLKRREIAPSGMPLETHTFG